MALLPVLDAGITQHRAALAACQAASGVDDARLLLDILGLLPEEVETVPATPAEAAPADLDPVAVPVAPLEQHSKATLTQCVDCGRAMVPQTRWCRMTTAQRTGRTLASAHGLCSACYARAKYHGTLPHPAPRTVVPAAVTVRVVATYTVRCDRCGDVATVADRGAAYRYSRDHRDSHDVTCELRRVAP